MFYDLIIIGGGPAGAAAGVYSARKKLKTLIIADSFGGQSLVSDSIENWIGVKKMTGLELARMLEEHVRAYENVEIKMPEKVTAIKAIKSSFSAQGGPASGWQVTTNKGKNYQAKTLIIASGSRRKELNVPGEKKFKGKGVAYCSTCDAPIFKDKVAAVVGGGNSSLEAAIDLIPYARKIYLLNRSGSRADPLIQEKARKSPKIAVINDAEVREILGNKFVSGLKYLDKKTNKIKKLAVEGVFVEIGTTPNSEIFKNFVKMNTAGEIIVNRETMATNHSGIFAAGDVTDEIYKQNNISAGAGVIAALSAYNYLLNIKKNENKNSN